MTPEQIETLAWNCGEWPEELAKLVEQLCERAGQVGDGMSTEQLVAYAILLERERCASYIERYAGMVPERQEMAADIRAGVSLDAWGQRRL